MHRRDLTALLCLFAACADATDDMGSAEGLADVTSSGDTQEGQSEGSGNGDGVATDEGGGTDSDFGSDADPIVSEPARGISVANLRINQGLAVTLAEDGIPVVPTFPLLTGRPSMITMDWSIADDWQPREIEGRLTIVSPSGAEFTRSSVLFIDAAPDPADPMSPSFQWVVPGEEIVPGSRYAVEMLELSPAPPSVEVDSPRLPASSTAPLPVDGVSRTIEVVLVPIDYNVAGCVTTTDQTLLPDMLDRAYASMPLTDLKVTLHDVVEFATPVADDSEILSRLMALRSAEAPQPHVYYIGIMDTCLTVAVGGSATTVLQIPPRPEEAPLRVAWVQWFSYAAEFSADTFVHELQHLMGRPHVRCNGLEDDVDLDYPLEGGGIGALPGWNLADGRWYDPRTTFDSMTYCEPSWASSYGWSTLAPVAEALTSWARAGAPPVQGNASALVGIRRPGGEVHQWIRVDDAGHGDETPGPERAWVVDAHGREAEAPTSVQVGVDSDHEIVIVGLPAAVSAPVALTLDDGHANRQYTLD